MASSSEGSILDRLKNSLWGQDHPPTAEDEAYMEEKMNRRGPSVRIPDGRQPRSRPKSDRHQRRAYERQKLRNKYKKEFLGPAPDDDEFFGEDEERERDEQRRARRGRSLRRGRGGDDGDEVEMEEARRVGSPAGSLDEDAAYEQAMAAEMQRQREEQEKDLLEEEQLKQLRRELFGDDGDEVEEVYVGSMSESREKWQGLWAGHKAVWYFLFMFGALFVWSHDYRKRVCSTGTTANELEICLFYNTTFTCTGLDYQDDNAAFPGGVPCANLCNTLRHAQGEDAGEGCKRFPAPVAGDPATYECLPLATFQQSALVGGCLDPYTCLDSDEADIKQAMLFIGILHLVSFIVCAAQAVGLFSYAAWHNTDFEDGLDTRVQRVLFCMTKLGPNLTQFVFIASVFAEIYLCFIFFAFASACSNSITIDGAKNDFPTDVRGYALGNAALLIIFLVCGSVIRHKWQMRGELFMPSFDEDIRIPYNLDCAEQQFQEPPKVFHNCCEGLGSCLRELGCTKYIYLLIVFVWDLVTSPILWFGKINSWVYKHRHFIGP